MGMRKVKEGRRKVEEGRRKQMLASVTCMTGCPRGVIWPFCPTSTYWTQPEWEGSTRA